MPTTLINPEEKPDSFLMTSPKAAAFLAISERKLWNLKDSGEIPHVPIGSSVRYDRRDLIDWINAKKKGGVASIESDPNLPALEA